MPRAAPPPRATPMRTPRRSWTSRSRPLASDRPQGSWVRLVGDLEVAAGEVAEVRHGRGHGSPAVQQPGDADLVAPAAGRHVDRLQPADRAVALGRRDEVDARSTSSISRAARQAPIRVDVEDDACGVLPLGHLPADSSASSDLPPWRSDRNRSPASPATLRVAEHCELLTHLAQAVDEPFGRAARGGRFVDQREHHRRLLRGSAEERLPQAAQRRSLATRRRSGCLNVNSIACS